MALVDFMKGRKAGQQQAVAGKTQEQNPQASNTETAKEKSTRLAVEEKTNRVAPTPDQEARARVIGEEMRKATQHSEQRGTAAPDTPADAGSNAAKLQKQDHQNKTQEALSPTDDAAGKAATQKKPQGQEKPSPRPQTLPRPRPSWER
jgi:hypothetical protein